MRTMNKTRYYIGTISAFAASIPWLWKSYYVLHLLAIDGVDSSIGVGPDMALGFGFDLVFLFVSMILMSLSQSLLRSWCKPALYILLGIVLMTLVQDATIYVLTDNLQECGYIDCRDAGLSEPKAPEVKTLK